MTASPHLDPKETIMTSFPEEDEPQEAICIDEIFLERAGGGGMVPSESTTSFGSPDIEGDPVSLIITQALAGPIRDHTENGLVTSGSTLTFATPYHSRSQSLDMTHSVEPTPRSHENSIVQAGSTSGITSSSISTIIIEPSQFRQTISPGSGSGSGSEGKLEEIGRAVQQECRDRSRMPSSA
eukprot:TRINITY_DN7392_c0_g1_i1.p1 TRINITY_DN7392_c0_g1~~TRINITY_DN7392_c0_g1_i1.p1  ORF type:complete len:182 (+),score=13.50 TRINITY_DN7392_c0_g1_i1:173-718(+)